MSPTLGILLCIAIFAAIIWIAVLKVGMRSGKRAKAKTPPPTSSSWWKIHKWPCWGWKSKLSSVKAPPSGFWIFLLIAAVVSALILNREWLADNLTDLEWWQSQPPGFWLVIGAVLLILLIWGLAKTGNLGGAFKFALVIGLGILLWNLWIGPAVAKVNREGASAAKKLKVFEINSAQFKAIVISGEDGGINMPDIHYQDVPAGVVYLVGNTEIRANENIGNGVDLYRYIKAAGYPSTIGIRTQFGTGHCRLDYPR